MSVSEITTCQSIVGFLTRLTVNHLTDTPANSNCRLTAGVRLPPSGWIKVCLLVFINSQGNVSELIDSRAPLDPGGGGGGAGGAPHAPQFENPWLSSSLSLTAR